MDNFEGKEFTGSCPKCDGDVDFLNHFYDYEFEKSVEVWACFHCRISIKVDPEDFCEPEILEVQDFPESI